MHVLIVDDNRDAADSLASLLDLWGYTTSVAYDGDSGYQAAVRLRPACVISDITMPVQDGHHLARRIKATAGLEGVRLIAVTAYSDERQVRQIEESGFETRLTKPADLDTLRRVLGMMDKIAEVAKRTEELAEKNVDLAAQTHEIAKKNIDLAGETKQLLEEVKEDIREIKNDVVELKSDVQQLRNDQPGPGGAGPR